MAGDAGKQGAVGAVWGWMRQAGFECSGGNPDRAEGQADEAWFEEAFARAQSISQGRLFAELGQLSWMVSDWFYAKPQEALGLLLAGFDPVSFGPGLADATFGRLHAGCPCRTRLIKRGLDLGWRPRRAEASAHPIDQVIWFWALGKQSEPDSREAMEALLEAAPDYGFEDAARAVGELPQGQARSVLPVVAQMIKARSERALMEEACARPSKRKAASL